MLASALASSTALAQRNPIYQIVFAPGNPGPTDTISVFIRAIDPSAGVVICPEFARNITSTVVTGNSILLRISNTVIAGGFPQTVCDGNTVVIGPLPIGEYAVTAAFTLPDGTPVNPPLATARLLVGIPQAVSIPVWDHGVTFVVALILAALAARVLKIERRRLPRPSNLDQ